MVLKSIGAIPDIGADSRTQRELVDALNYPNFVARLREACQQCLIQVTVPPFSYFRPNWQFDKLNPLVDFFIPLTSDYSGGWETRTNHISPLATNPSKPSASIQTTLNELKTEGILLNKVVLRTTAVGSSWTGVNAKNQGLYQTSTGPSLGTWDNSQSGATGLTAYREIVELLKNPEFQLNWDDDVQAHSIYHAKQKQFISFESLQSLDHKLALTQEMKLAGIAIWDLPSDTQGPASLLFHSFSFYHSYRAFWASTKAMLKPAAPWLLGGSLGALFVLLWKIFSQHRKVRKTETRNYKTVVKKVSELPQQLDQILYLARTPPKSIADRLNNLQQQQLEYLASLSAQMQYQLSPLTQALSNTNGQLITEIHSNNAKPAKSPESNTDIEAFNRIYWPYWPTVQPRKNDGNSV